MENYINFNYIYFIYKTQNAVFYSNYSVNGLQIVMLSD